MKCTSKGTTCKLNYYDSLNNIDFIDVRNFEVRDRRVYEIGLIAIRDVSPLFCAGSSHGMSVQAPYSTQMCYSSLRF